MNDWSPSPLASTVDAVPSPGLDYGRDVEEIDDLTDVGDWQAGGVGVAVDRDDPHAQLTKTHERAALVPSGTDEEDARVLDRAISAPYHLQP